MKHIVSGLMIVLLLFSSYGCAAVLIGAGVAGGVAVSKDTAEIARDTSYNKAWKATYETLDKMGAINFKDKDAGQIKANVQDTEITATVKQITDKTVKVDVKARKHFFPNLDLALEIVDTINKKI